MVPVYSGSGGVSVCWVFVVRKSGGDGLSSGMPEAYSVLS